MSAFDEFYYRGGYNHFWIIKQECLRIVWDAAIKHAESKVTADNTPSKKCLCEIVPFIDSTEGYDAGIKFHADCPVHGIGA